MKENESIFIFDRYMQLLQVAEHQTADLCLTSGEKCKLSMFHKSAFYWPECTQTSISTVSREDDREFPPANWGVQTYMRFMLMAALALQPYG